MFPGARYLTIAFSVSLMLACHNAEPTNAQETPRFPEFADHQLGRNVWLENCQGCHVPGAAGAPQVSDYTAWQPRIAQGIEVLHDHAINGHWGPNSTHMPPKGGQENLTDDEVKAAVNYMVELVLHRHQTTGE